ncbi:MAG: ABC transporter ATP-binding protein [Lachnospiraceae bacterium]|nr:ABC transporter ATP-binding protein [Lachnospiraceae bacterium]
MIFEAASLSIGYGGTAVVSDINISLERGEILSVIGPNGSGKSTFLKTASGALKAIGGRIILDSREIGSYNSAELSKKTAVLTTDRVRPEYMTGRELMETGRYPYTGRMGILSIEDKRAVDEVTALTGTGELKDKLFNNLSDGEKQRLLFARALCQEPELLIMDEPLSYLDIRYKLELIHILKNLCTERKLTVIMSVHEVFLAAKISDKLLSFKEGRVFGAGRTEEIFTDGFVQTLYDINDVDLSFIRDGYMLE